MKKTILQTFVVISLLAIILITPSAQAALTLTLVAGTHTNISTDVGNTGYISLPFGTVVGNWTINSFSAYSQPFTGDSTDDYVVVNMGSDASTGSTPLKITATETGFTPFPTANGTFDMVVNNFSGASVNSNGMINSATIGTFTTPTSSALTTNLPVSSGLTSTFSMTEQLVVNTPSSGPVFGELYLFTNAVVPEPSAWVLAVLGLVGLFGTRRIGRR